MPYVRTKPSVRAALGERLLSHCASEAVALGRIGSGNPLTMKSNADGVRGRTQAYDMKRQRSNVSCSQGSRKQLDEMSTLNWYSKTEGKDYIRMQEISEEPLVLLATNKQLSDLSRFCTNEIDFSYLSVDPTFNFGNFSVTPTSYRNILLENRKNGKTPVFVGPIFVHHTKRPQTYLQFFDKLKSMKPELSNLLVFGTDGEVALFHSLSQCFEKAIHLRCFLHFRNNVKSQLEKIGVPSKSLHLKEIFGYQEGTTYELGLLDSTSDEMFDAVLHSLKEPWAKREANKSNNFYTWMMERSSMMKACMIASVRTKAGLGFPPAKFYTNDSENTNSRLRHKTQGKELGETAFAKAAKELIENEQESEVILALHGASQRYKIRDAFKRYELSSSDWYNMNEEQRKSYVENIYSLPVSELYSNCTTSSNLFTPRQQVISSTTLSQPHSLVQNIDAHIAEFMWKKASRIFAIANSILPAPSKKANVDAFSVLSESEDIPNYVHIMNDKKATCTCKHYKPKKICSHIIAVAEKKDMLLELIRKFNGQKITNNLSDIANMGLNTAASGRKQDAKRKRQHLAPIQTYLQMPSSLINTTPNQSLAVDQTPLIPQAPINVPPSTQMPQYMQHPQPANQPLYTSPMQQQVPRCQPLQQTYQVHRPYTPPTSTYQYPQHLNTVHMNRPDLGVPAGVPLPPAPAIPETNNPYFVALIKGNISKCHGCGGKLKEAGTVDAMFAIGRKESDWYPFLYGDGSKCWKMGKAANKYYHLNLGCIQARHPSFRQAQISPPLLDTSHIVVTDLLRGEWFARFGVWFM